MSKYKTYIVGLHECDYIFRESYIENKRFYYKHYINFLVNPRQEYERKSLGYGCFLVREAEFIQEIK